VIRRTVEIGALTHYVRVKFNEAKHDPALRGREGAACGVVPSREGAGRVRIEFSDGVQAVVSRFAIRRLPV